MFPSCFLGSFSIYYPLSQDSRGWDNFGEVLKPQEDMIKNPGIPECLQELEEGGDTPLCHLFPGCQRNTNSRISDVKQLENTFFFSGTGIFSEGVYIWKNLGDWWHVDMRKDEEVGSLRSSLEWCFCRR